MNKRGEILTAILLVAFAAIIAATVLLNDDKEPKQDRHDYARKK